MGKGGMDVPLLKGVGMAFGSNAGLVQANPNLRKSSRLDLATAFALAVLSFFPPVTSSAQSTGLAQSSVNTELTTQMPESETSSAVRRRISLSWKADLDGESFANEREQAQTAGFGVTARFRYRMLQGLEARSTLSARMQNGYAQSRFGDNTPRSGLDLGEALVQLRYPSFFTLQAGAIDQAHLKAPLLVSSRAFLGASEKIRLGDRVFNVELKAQQTIPSSTTLSAKTVEAEPTPSFTTETLQFNVAPANGRMKLNVFGTHFSFKNLPSAVASGSELHGNTVIDPGPNQARFKFEFDGWLAGGGAQVGLLPGLAWILDGHVMQNTKAPESYKNAQLVSTGFEIGLPGEVDLTPKVEMFFAESDAAPAFYSDARFGQMNRQGWGAGIEAAFKKQGFKVGGRYVQADVLNPNLLQSRQQFLMIQFETLYDSLL
jgi:hypothetical protein